MLNGIRRCKAQPTVQHGILFFAEVEWDPTVHCRNGMHKPTVQLRRGSDKYLRLFELRCKAGSDGDVAQPTAEHFSRRNFNPGLNERHELHVLEPPTDHTPHGLTDTMNMKKIGNLDCTEDACVPSRFLFWA